MEEMEDVRDEKCQEGIASYGNKGGEAVSCLTARFWLLFLRISFVAFSQRFVLVYELIKLQFCHFLVA